MMMEELLKRRQQIEQDLKILQQDIYQSEETYLQETWNTGNVVKGFEGYLSNKSHHQQRIKSSSSTTSTYKIKDKDRIFSDSSAFLKFDKNGRKQTDSPCISYGRIEFVDETSLIWDPVPIVATSTRITYNNNHHINNNYNNNNGDARIGEENGTIREYNQLLIDNNTQLSDQQLMPPPPKQLKSQSSSNKNNHHQ